jgi:hypothetical protein
MVLQFGICDCDRGQIISALMVGYDYVLNIMGLQRELL